MVVQSLKMCSPGVRTFGLCAGTFACPIVKENSLYDYIDMSSTLHKDTAFINRLDEPGAAGSTGI